jgi:cytochrome c oxidase cbb3-type subunit 3
MKKRRNGFVFFVLAVFAGAVYVPSIDQAAAAELLLNPMFWMVSLVVIFLIISSIAIHSALDSIKYYVLRKEGRLDELEVLEADELQDDWFARTWKKLLDARPIEQESEIDLDHEYDGIRELDNNLPPWWLYGFYLSIVFAVIYLVRFHITQTAPLQEEEYRIAMAEAEAEHEKYLATAANLVDESNVVLLTEAPLIQDGAAIFKANCAVCHAADGGGGVGPNLADPYWIHGGDIKAVFSTIKYGVPAKGMIPWKDQLNPSQMQKVASFVLSMQGTTPANPKEAQGELYVPEIEEAAAEADTTLSDSTIEATLKELPI